MVFQQRRFWLHSGISNAVVDTIGAGDSHAGGVLAGLALVCHWRMLYYWAMQWRRGLRASGR